MLIAFPPSIGIVKRAHVILLSCKSRQLQSIDGHKFKQKKYYLLGENVVLFGGHVARNVKGVIGFKHHRPIFFRLFGTLTRGIEGLSVF